MHRRRTDSEGLLAELTRFLTAHPTAMVTLLAEHVDDGTGHCRSCRIGNQSGFLAWPCTLHAAAALASTAASTRR